MIVKKLKTGKRSRKKMPIHGDKGRIVVLEDRIQRMERQISEMKETMESHSKKLKISGSIITKLKLKIG